MKNEMPKVSIIVPIYNVESYIDECMKSLVNQTMREIEIICVDDCGTDGSMAVVERYAASDPRIKIVRHERNGGLATSRNTGLAKCTAPYVMMCDSDDYYKPQMCERMYAAINDSGADVAICGVDVLYQADHEMRAADDDYYSVKHDGLIDIDDALVTSTNVVAWNKIWRRDIIMAHGVKFPDGLRYEDNYFFYSYMPWAKKIFFVPERLYVYRRRTGSIMNQTYEKCDFVIEHTYVAIRLWDYIRQHNLSGRYADMFFGTVLRRCVLFTLQHAGGVRNRRRTMRLFRKFIRENYDANMCTAKVRRIVLRVYDGVPYCSGQWLGGLVRQISHDERYELLVCGLSLYKIKYLPECARYYILGIGVRTKKYA